NVYFKDDITNGDEIHMTFTSGTACDIVVRDPDDQDNSNYGTAHYDGGAQEVAISLSGLAAPQAGFNLDMDFGAPYLGAELDWVHAMYSPIGPKQFDQHAYINQTFSTPQQYNLSYTLNFSTAVTKFSGVAQADLTLRINETSFWSKTISGLRSLNPEKVNIPGDLLQGGGQFRVVFDLHLVVDTTAETDFEFTVDSAYLHQRPILDFLKDSDCEAGTPPWIPKSYTTGYAVSHQAGNDPPNRYFSFYTSSAGTQPEEWGFLSLKQEFSKNSSIDDYQHLLRYFPLNMTGVQEVNLSVQLNETYVLENFTITTESSDWEEIRVNRTDALPDGDYVFNLTLTVQLANGFSSDPNWEFFVDDIYLCPVWNGTLTRQSWDGNLTAGGESNARYYYNMTDAGDPIPDAKIVVRNNDTGKEWGLDNSTSRKYQVTNHHNGTYDVLIGTIGYEVGLYNLSVTTQRLNFPDCVDYIQVNITGSPANVTFTEGAHYNDTWGMWFVDEDNTPYVDDATHEVTINVTDDITGEPILDAFVEAQLGDNLLGFRELYKQTGNPADKGLYAITLNTTGMDPASEYLMVNFTVRVTAQGYSASPLRCSTKIDLIPTALAIPELGTIYEDSTFTLSAIFQDTFHGTSINEATINWEIVGTTWNGVLQFIFLGYYESDISLKGLPAGNYTLNLTGSKPDYETTTIQRNLEVLPKYNISVAVSHPSYLIEENKYFVTYTFEYKELGSPVVGELMDFVVKYNETEKQQEYSLYTNENGIVELELDVPLGERDVKILLTYAGQYNVSSFTNETIITVNPKYSVVLTLLTQDFPGELVGETNIELSAQLRYANGTAIAGMPLVFTIGSSKVTVVTDSNGTATVALKLPTEGTFAVNVTFEGSSEVYATSIAPVSVSIVSPTTVAVRRLINYAVIAAIVAALAVSSYVGVKRGVVVPRRRRRQAEYVQLLNHFEDARNAQLLMVINREAGTEIYSKSLSGVPVDPTLVSGFLQAISQFGKEIKVDGKAGSGLKKGKGPRKEGLQELAFHHFKIVLQESMHFRVALLLLKSPSERVLDALRHFTEQVEKRFGTKTDILSGKQLDEGDIWDLIEKFLEVSLIYVHIIDFESARIKQLDHWEQLVLEGIEHAPFFGEAYLDKVQDHLAQEHVGKELEILKAALSLRERKALIPLAPEYMEFRLGIKQAIDSLPPAYKTLVMEVGDGVNDPEMLKQVAKVSEQEFAVIVQQLRELGMITEKFTLDLPGKVVYTSLRCAPEDLSQLVTQGD
ncbi:MAG: Ig-like domain-containing protein, partial [Promethearchaeota archaeon]